MVALVRADRHDAVDEAELDGVERSIGEMMLQLGLQALLYTVIVLYTVLCCIVIVILLDRHYYPPWRGTVLYCIVIAWNATTNTLTPLPTSTNPGPGHREAHVALRRGSRLR